MARSLRRDPADPEGLEGLEGAIKEMDVMLNFYEQARRPWTQTPLLIRAN